MSWSTQISSSAHSATGLVAGTLVSTADGQIPVEYLQAGDRVISRLHGLAPLERLSSCVVTTHMVYVAPGALGDQSPDSGIQLPAAQTILLRGWRSVAMFKTEQSVVPLGCATDDGAIKDLGLREVRMFQLSFKRPVVIYANGLEIAIRPSDVTLHNAA